MAREYSRHVPEQALQEAPLAQLQLLAESRVNKGMITVIDAADIDLGACVLAKNMNVRYDKTSRRTGYSLFTPVRPDNNQVLKLVDFKNAAGIRYIFRITKNSVYITDLTSWTNLAWAGSAGTDDDQIIGTVAFDVSVGDYRLFFVNEGKNKIQVCDLTGHTVSDVDAASTSKVAPKAKYLTYFDNRLVAANDPSQPAGPISVYWSGDGNFMDFDSTVDVTAGQDPLQESPGDRSDFITGIFGFTNVLVIPRERSIWLGTKQPSGQEPFYFYGAVPGIGCNCPYSMDVMPHGLVFVDTTSGSVWAYAYGYNYGYVSGSTAPERIGLPVENEIMKAITDPTLLKGSYSPYHNEYAVAIPNVGAGIVRIWKFNFKTKAWSYDEKQATVTAMEDVESIPLVTPISALQGMISQLQGTIGGLGATIVQSSTRLYGLANGDIQRDDQTSDIDADGVYTSEYQSKDFWFPDIDMYCAEIRVEYLAHIAGELTINYSKDGGRTWRFGKTVTPDLLEVPQLLRFRKHIKARRLRFQLISTRGVYDILSYEVHDYPGAESKKAL